MGDFIRKVLEARFKKYLHLSTRGDEMCDPVFEFACL